MYIKTLKRFIFEECRAPVMRFPWFGLGLLMVMTAPIWSFFVLLQNVPQQHTLTQRNGVIKMLEPVSSKIGGGTRVRLATETEVITFRVQFCRPFPATLTLGQSIVVWLTPDGMEAWQVHQNGREVCSYEKAVSEVTAANFRLPLITIGQIFFGFSLLLVAFFLWQSRNKRRVN